jgi:hypothetical protein
MGPPDSITAWGMGALGSLAIELATAVKLTTENQGSCPPIYKKPFYCVIRVGFAMFCAGPLAALMDAASYWSAFYLGISAPLVYDRLARGLQPEAPTIPPRDVASIL